ncbi:hypothetical protein PLICRDRAFT_693173 [Plicaturopsis crispa FD-325 SS-3]|nr:hypothetical protein PLICRDRAFT_693173 [Plicaturopsis crispa FD-325 SS-3]
MLPAKQLSDLPIELLDEIINHAYSSRRNDVIACCRTSTAFRHVATRRLYRNITLVGPSTIMACCKTLIANPTAAQSVRSFNVQASRIPFVFYLRRPTVFPAFYRVLRAALTCLENLLELDLHCHDPHGISLPSGPCMPRLVRFDTDHNHAAAVAAFLERHPSLQQIALCSLDHCETALFESVRLPSLHTFQGVVQHVPLVLPGAPLRSLSITFLPMDEDHEGIVRNLAQYAPHLDTLQVAVAASGSSDILVRAIATHFPNIQSLTLGMLPSIYPTNSSNITVSIRDNLSQFKKLQSIFLPCMEYFTFTLGPSLDSDFETVCELGNLCPTIRTCLLPSNVLWIHVRDAIWYPGQHSSGRQWLRRKMAAHHPAFEGVGKVVDGVLNAGLVVPGEWLEVMQAHAEVKNLVAELNGSGSDQDDDEDAEGGSDDENIQGDEDEDEDGDDEDEGSDEDEDEDEDSVDGEDGSM